MVSRRLYIHILKFLLTWLIFSVRVFIYILSIRVSIYKLSKVSSIDPHENDLNIYRSGVYHVISTLFKWTPGSRAYDISALGIWPFLSY